MRVLVNSKSSNSFFAMEITCMGYDENLFDDKSNKKGLWMCDVDGDLNYIPDMTLEDCNYICEQIVRTGCADLTRYGKCVTEND